MAIEYLGLSSINGPLVVLEGVKGAAYDEIVEMDVNGKDKKLGCIVEINDDKAVIQVFEGTEGMALRNTHTRLTGHPMEIGVSADMLGRTFNGLGQPIDDLGPINADKILDVNGKPLNPVTREYPRNYIRTGISAIDGLMTLIRGQKLPIFSGNGLPHDELAAQLVRQSSLGDDANSDEKFAIVFAAMGVKHDVADFFKRTFEESGVSDHVATFINLANDPVVERLITPKVALTLAEYLAFEKGMHILVILTDMTSFAEAMREVSSSKGEIPSRKGFPGYLYSELATIYERAGIVSGVNGSVTQMMKDGIGEGFTRKDHQDVANQLFSCYAKVGDARALASVIGEDELSETDQTYLLFGREFEKRFIGQGKEENRTIFDTLEIGWQLLGLMPRAELDRIDTKVLDQYYKKTKINADGDIVEDILTDLDANPDEE